VWGRETAFRRNRAGQLGEIEKQLTGAISSEQCPRRVCRCCGGEGAEMAACWGGLIDRHLTMSFVSEPILDPALQLENQQHPSVGGDVFDEIQQGGKKKIHEATPLVFAIKSNVMDTLLLDTFEGSSNPCKLAVFLGATSINSN